MANDKKHTPPAPAKAAAKAPPPAPVKHEPPKPHAAVPVAPEPETPVLPGHELPPADRDVPTFEDLQRVQNPPSHADLERLAGQTPTPVVEPLPAPLPPKEPVPPPPPPVVVVVSEPQTGKVVVAPRTPKTERNGPPNKPIAGKK